MAFAVLWRVALASLAALLALVSCANSDVTSRVQQTQSALRRGNEQFEWFPVRTPPLTWYGTMVYDEARQQLVLTGGYSVFEAAISRRVWEHGASLGWHERTANALGPVGRAQLGLAYDARRQRTVMFGGRDRALLPSRELWEWDGYAWQSRTPQSGGPTARFGVAMTYDRARAHALVFGGRAGSQLSREFWAWDGERWSELTVPVGGPAARTSASLVYDTARARAVLFGGELEGGTSSSETWEWDGQSWLQVALEGSHPGPRTFATLAYDELRQRSVLYGGSSAVVNDAELWEWDGVRWQQHTVPSDGPSVREGVQLAYDASRQAVALMGGAYDGTEWLWDGTAWRIGAAAVLQPSVRQSPLMAQDTSSDHVVMFGGYKTDAGNPLVNLFDTWEWTASGWVEHPTANHPSGSSLGGIAYDQARQQTVVHGGVRIEADGTLTQNNETWTYDGLDWTLRAPVTAPPSRRGMGMAYDVERARVVMFGGVIGAAYADDVWEWDGASWSDRTPATGGPSPRSSVAMTYDPRTRTVLLLGGLELAGRTNDLWSWNGSVWSALEGSDGVRPLATVTTLVPAIGRSSTLAITAGDPSTYGGLSTLYEWEGGMWTRLPLQRAPSANRDFGVAAQSAGALLFSGGDGTATRDLTERLTSRGAACSSAADSTTGFCVDGVSCTSSQCAACETCADPSDAGRCMPVRSRDDDSCGAAQASTCDAAGRCKLALGGASPDAAACVSGFVSDGVCCEVAACGACRTCNAAEKEIPDNAGRCGTRQAGTDPRDDCSDEPASTCGRDGTCDGRGNCRLHVSGTTCGPVLREPARVSSSVCTGAGTCIVVDASCDGEHTLIVPGDAPTDCGAYACEGASCKSSCSSIGDCASGFLCNQEGACAAPDALRADEKGGCSCRVGAPVPGEAGLLVLLALCALLARGRRRSVLAVGGTLAACVAACTLDAPRTSVTSMARAALTGDETVAWQHIGFPSPRIWSMATYDVARKGVFLFGGRGDGNLLSDIYRDQWSFDGTRWLEQTPAVSGPSIRSAGMVTYDRQREVVLLYGGGLSPEFGSASNDLWQWDGVAWRRIEPKGPWPTSRYLAGFAYDDVRQRAVLFGGADAAILGDTWEWDGAAWNPRTPASGGPSPRFGATLTYDPVRQVSVLFGGYDGATHLAETWEWDGVTWTDQSAPEAPSGRIFHGATYDRARSRLVIFAGSAEYVDDEIWERGPDGAWSERTPPVRGPGEVNGGALAYDEVRQRTVAFGGRLSLVRGEAWEWDGSSWSARTPPPQPEPRTQSAMVFDSVRQRTLLFGGDRGGAALQELWSWDGSAWSDRTSAEGPSARHGAALASSDVGAVLVFGGTPNGTDPLGDLWQLDDAIWTQRSFVGGPQPRWDSGFAYDVARSRWVLFGGSTVSAALGDTWEWDGTVWTERHPLHSPSARSGAALSYDPERHVVVAFAGKDHAMLANRELWEWDGLDWTERTQATTGPPPPLEVKSVYDARLQRTLYVLSPGSLFGQNNEVWAWDGNVWTHVPVDVAPALVGDFTLGFDAARERVVLFGELQSFPAAPVTATWELLGRGAPCTSDAEASTGHCVDGVACEMAACAGTCESCNVAGSVGRCAKIVLGTDPDTCSGAQICDALGACKGNLGQPAASAADCASGFLVDGVCCETAACGACSTCSAAQKEIGDNDGRCGTQRSGTDLRDDCAASPAESCGLDGSCDGRGACASYARGTPCAASAICSGAGECVVQAAVCEGDGAVRAASGKVSSCAGFRCVEGACQTRCMNVADCVEGAVCTRDGLCVPAANEAGGEGGCACDVAGASTGGWSLGALALGALAVVGRRRRRMMESEEICS